MKIRILLLSLILALTISGCGDNQPVTSSTDAQSNIVSVSDEHQTESEDMVNETDTEDSTLNNDEASNIDYLELIPDPKSYFPNSDFSVVNESGEMYYCQFYNYSKEEYESYIEKCKEMGFTSVEYETEIGDGKWFKAYSEDGKYQIETQMGSDSNKTGYVFCQPVTEDDTIE